jgi:hypothetical protein
VVVENTGDVGQDVIMEWNLTRTDTGESLDAGGDTILAPANFETTYTATPNTAYVGEVRITFLALYSGTERAGAYDIFDTAAYTPPPPPPPPGGDEGGGPAGGPGGVGPGPLPEPEIEISDYPQEIATETGWPQYPSVIVNNTGLVTLHNVRVYLTGIPASWYTVQPSMLPILNAGVSKAFIINLLVPDGTEAREYFGTIKAEANETYDEKLTSVIVFGSREDLIRYQLRKLKEEFVEFKEDVNATAEEGLRDLSRVYNIIEEIQHQIDLTEGYLDAKMYDEALDSIKTGWRLLDRGRELLRDAPTSRVGLVIPDWMLTLLLILVIVILVIAVLLLKYKKKLERLFKREVPEASYAAEMIGGEGEAAAETAALPGVPAEGVDTAREQEKEKIRKVIALLEKEYNEGIISEKAYNDLRKSNEEKLNKMGG